jgi:hypothetical protein
VFPLIKENKMWLGYGFHRGDAYFKVPETADTSNYAKGVYDPETRLVHFRNCCWFTNIDHGKRHEILDLCTMAQLKKRGVEFPKYDNYNAIEVSKGAYIPKDYKGVMGVPITWLDKYCPEQFEILGATESEGQGFSNGLWKGGKAQAVVKGTPVYKRIFIRHKPATEDTKA